MTLDEDKLIEYVMGALSPDEEREVASYLNAHPEEAAKVRDYFEGITALALEQDPVALPEDAEDRLLARIQALQSPEPEMAVPAAPVTTLHKRRRPVWLSLAAAALALAAWLGFLRPAYQDFRYAQQIQQLCTSPDIICDVLVSDANLTLGMLARHGDNRVTVFFDDPPPQERVYQAWEIRGETPESLGIWEERVLRVETPLTDGSAFGVSLEPPGGSPQPTQPPIVVYALEPS